MSPILSASKATNAIVTYKSPFLGGIKEMQYRLGSNCWHEINELTPFKLIFVVLKSSITAVQLLLAILPIVLDLYDLMVWNGIHFTFAIGIFWIAEVKEALKKYSGNPKKCWSLSVSMWHTKEQDFLYVTDEANTEYYWCLVWIADCR